MAKLPGLGTDTVVAQEYDKQSPQYKSHLLTLGGDANRGEMENVRLRKDS